MLLFLDFDGVLHPENVRLIKGRPTLIDEGVLFMWEHHLEALLAPHHHVRIVLSTTWARRLGFQRAKKYLSPALQARVIGATWHSGMDQDRYYNVCIYGDSYRPKWETWWDLASRYQQIARYVERARVQEWVAIDDDDEGWPDEMRDRLVHTNEQQGLGDPETRERLETLLGRSAK